MTIDEAIRILKLSIRDSREHIRFCYDKKGITALEMAIKALEQEPSGSEKPNNCDFQIGDEVRMIGSYPIYDDCDVGWVIRNASEKVKTMYVMRNDGSADEENKAEWYKTGRHNAILAEAIKALPSVKPQEPKTGHWIRKTKVDGVYDIAGVKTWGVKCQCDKCDFTTIVIEDFGYYKYCPNCGTRMEVEQNG